MQITRITYEETATFAEALSHKEGNYEDTQLLAEAPREPHFMKRAVLTQQPEYFAGFLSALTMAAMRTEHRPLRVMDFGGALGGHWSYAEAAFDGAVPMLWQVVETPMYAEYGASFVRDPALRYATSIDAVEGDIDVAYFSGVLGYVPDWRPVLDHPKVREAKFVLITRTAVSEREIPYVQRVWYGERLVTYPGRILRESDLNGSLSGTHSLLASWRLYVGILNQIFEAPAMLWIRKD